MRRRLGLTKNYSTPAYAPGKLVDEYGQGSSNDSYGRTLPVTAAEQIDLYLPQTTLGQGLGHGESSLGSTVAVIAVPTVIGWLVGWPKLGGLVGLGLAWVKGV